MKKILILLMVFTFNKSFSQYNDSTNHRIGYAGTGVLNKTQTGTNYVISNALNFNVKKKDLSVNSISSYIFGQQLKTLTNNDFSSVFDVNLAKTFPHFYYWGLAAFDKTYSLKINNREQVGLGGAYNFVDEKDAFFNVSEGVIHENSNLKLTDSTHYLYRTFRNSFRLRYHFVVKQLLILDGTDFLQNSLSYGNDYIIKLVNTATFKLNKWLGLTTAFNYNKIQQTKRETLLVTFGLNAEKYF
jgi:hypothetical protein